jgi:hypothetical protein
MGRMECIFPPPPQLCTALVYMYKSGVGGGGSTALLRGRSTRSHGHEHNPFHYQYQAGKIPHKRSYDKIVLLGEPMRRIFWLGALLDFKVYEIRKVLLASETSMRCGCV